MYAGDTQVCFQLEMRLVNQARVSTCQDRAKAEVIIMGCQNSMSLLFECPTNLDKPP